jgi:hypothetical protein
MTQNTSRELRNVTRSQQKLNLYRKTESNDVGQSCFCFAFCPQLSVSGQALRACLAGLLTGSGSGSSRGALPNIFLEKPFLSKKKSRSRFGEATNSKTPLALLEEPCQTGPKKEFFNGYLKKSW